MDVYDGAGNPIDLSPKTLPWVKFEADVAECIEQHLESWIGLSPHKSKIVRRPKYYSPRRKSHITFDVSLEIFAKGQPKKPVLLWLFECKDFPTRLVTVDDIEEFHDKMEQVDAHKGAVFTRLGFQKSAIALAKSYRMGLMTLRKQEVFVIQFSQDGGIVGREEIHATFCLYSDGTIAEANLIEFIKVQICRFLESQGLMPK